MPTIEQLEVPRIWQFETRIVEYNSYASKGYSPKETEPEVMQLGDRKHKELVQ
jgi:hypothetical protein